MKVLGLATGLVVALIGGIFVWALASGSPLSGEPTAFLQIKKDKYIAAPLKRKVAAASRLSAGQMQVVLDVTPRGQNGVRPASPSVSSRYAGLFEPSRYGLLPKRASDGRSPATAWARSGVPAADTKPRIAVLFSGLGLNKRLSQLAVKKLPANITLSFSPYGRHLKTLVAEAGRQGHEMMLEVPMEPLDYPQSDTGPKTLLVAHSEEENRPRLHWALGRFTGYFGIVNGKGRRYLANKKAVGELFRELQQRGLYFFRDHAAGSARLTEIARQTGVGYSQATLEIDRTPNRRGIAAALKKLELVARRSGMAVGVAHMHPVSISMISQWASGLEGRGFRLVPVSTTYRAQQGSERR